MAIARYGTANFGEIGTATVYGTFTQAGLQTAINNIQTAVAALISGTPEIGRPTVKARIIALGTINVGGTNYVWETRGAPGAIWINPNIINSLDELRIAINQAAAALERGGSETVEA